jgi:hypothetical protein
MKFIITEDEKRQIKSLYEQNETGVETKIANIDDIATELLPKNFIKIIDNELVKNKELQSKINQVYNEKLPQNPLTYLQSKGIVPYIFIVPNYITGVGFPTTGLAVKIGNTPITVSMNLGTNPKDIPSSLKFSQVRMNFPINK